MMLININFMSMGAVKIPFKFTYLFDSVGGDVCCCFSSVAWSSELQEFEDATSLNSELEEIWIAKKF